MANTLECRLGADNGESFTEVFSKASKLFSGSKAKVISFPGVIVFVARRHKSVLFLAVTEKQGFVAGAYVSDSFHITGKFEDEFPHWLHQLVREVIFGK